MLGRVVIPATPGAVARGMVGIEVGTGAAAPSHVLGVVVRGLDMIEAASAALEAEGGGATWRVIRCDPVELGEF